MTLSLLLVEPVPAVARLSAYTAGRPEYEMDLILDFNENLEALKVPGDTVKDATPPVNRYPEATAFEARLAAHIGVDPSSVLITNGADDALERTVRSVCCVGRKAILTIPTYGMIRRFVFASEAEMVEIEWWRDPFPIDEVCAKVDKSTSLLAIVTPNNPSGAVITRDELEEVLERNPRTLVIIDQAYREFADPEYDLTEVALSHPNALIVRTFSKAWGAAGLRCGYAVGDPRVVDWLRRFGLPFPVSSLSIAALERALEQPSWPSCERIEAIRSQREDLGRILAELGAEPLPSHASFVFAKFADSSWVRTAMASLGIGIRGFPGRPEVEGWLRTTLPGSAPEFDRLVDGFRTVLQPKAVIFDLDGVLADVSQSYRATILATAEEFGVKLTANEIARAKASGNANNDWILTQRLLQERGVECSLADVTDRFEAIYQGTESSPGLRRNERLLIKLEKLRSLADRYHLAVVTGRPRADAEKFLEIQSIADCFTAVITMEDAPSKPNPAPVRLALERLGVRHAWMVGDTPDDLEAARGAAVLPIGVPAAGEDEGTARKTLVEAGAARVLNSTEEILEVLP